jgi:hypothetical protein
VAFLGAIRHAVHKHRQQDPPSGSPGRFSSPGHSGGMGGFGALGGPGSYVGSVGYGGPAVPY